MNQPTYNYIVRRERLRHDGRLFVSGQTVPLSEAQAAPLMLSGAVGRIVDKAVIRPMTETAPKPAPVRKTANKTGRRKAD
ncbi:MAG: hypothetical protein Q4G71_10025 [Pseudomonadota bacterium]|nr:hypothetical protein [Pseudomonadota bacterium]